MKNSTIGILQADGSFFPVVEESQIGKKHLILTAARPDQDNVKIDIRRSSEDDTPPASVHLGTLALQKSGDGDIVLELELDAAGHLTASAAWPQGGAKQSIAVDLNDYRESSLLEAEPDPFSQIPDLESDERTDDRSDRDILADTSLDAFELDEIPSESDSLDLEELPPEESTTKGSDSSDSLTLDLPDLDAFGTEATPDEDFPSLDDLDAGFDENSTSDESSRVDEPPKSKESSDDELYNFPDLSLDSEVPSIELSDSKLSSSDFETSSFDFEEESSQPSFSDKKPDEKFQNSDWDTRSPEPEPQKPPRAAKSSPSHKPVDEAPPPLTERGFAPVDRVALLLSLTTLGLLILVLLGLLFLNFLRPVSPPAIKPEVFLPTLPTKALAMTKIEPSNPLEVPAALRGGAFSYTLRPGDRALDLMRKLGPIDAERRSDAWIW